jgi:uncharacterized protein
MAPPSPSVPPPMRATCAHCEAPIAPRPANPFYPFCSKRCRMADLGSWFGEEFRIPGPPAPVLEPPLPQDCEEPAL